MRKFKWILVFLIGSAYAQDASKVLGYDSYMEQVMTYHPVVFQAEIAMNSGEAQLRSARGNFDPKLIGDINQKYFKGTQYYNQSEAGLKIPTWFGLSFQAGYEQNNGVYLNPERIVPDAGLWYAGLRLDLGNGLIMNDRRAQLEKAKLYNLSSVQDRRMIRNQLHFDASLAYYKWQATRMKVLIYEEALKNATIRFESVKDASIFGDKPYIDTVESFILVQSRQLLLNEATTDFKNAEQLVELFLWSDGIVPLELEAVYPEQFATDLLEVDNLIDTDSIVNNHPYLIQNELKVEANVVDLKLQRERLKPDLTLKYNAISEPIGGDPLAQYNISNYNWGASFAYPILSRKARGKVQLSKLKLEDQRLQLSYLEEELKYKIGTTMNTLRLTEQQYLILDDMVKNNNRLFNAEVELFNLGESSVFMINSRENKLLKSRNERVEAQFKLKQQVSQLDLILQRNR